ncbi:MAG: glycoside hydrolase family 43 protein [Rhodanobacteraceae bacterium]
MSDEIQAGDLKALVEAAISKPLVTHIHTADPSAHVFEGRVYVYASHDIDAGIPFNDNGDHFGMEDYHVLCMDSPEREAADAGVALHVRDVPWAVRQMWAPDAATRDGRYYLYFPAKRADGIFQIGVAISDRPEGPFRAEPEAIRGSYSIDPAVFADADGAHYMYFGGLWGGQLQKYRNNVYAVSNDEPGAREPALGPRVARLTDDMTQFAESPREALVVDANGEPLLAGDNERRYFEGPWMHRHGGRYYLSYSTGDTHYLCHAIGDNPYGPFTYAGRILTPVVGWTTHHSIVEFGGRWWLYYHDSLLSGGVTHLRSIKVVEMHYAADGRIVTIHPYGMNNPPR